MQSACSGIRNVNMMNIEQQNLTNIDFAFKSFDFSKTNDAVDNNNIVKSPNIKIDSFVKNKKGKLSEYLDPNRLIEYQDALYHNNNNSTSLKKNTTCTGGNNTKKPRKNIRNKITLDIFKKKYSKSKKDDKESWSSHTNLLSSILA